MVWCGHGRGVVVVVLIGVIVVLVVVVFRGVLVSCVGVCWDGVGEL